jgi:hypothetical protein
VNTFKMNPAVASEAFGQTGIRHYVEPAATAACMVLLMLSMLMWARSYWWADSFTQMASRTWLQVDSYHGSAVIKVLPVVPPTDQTPSGFTYSSSSLKSPYSWSWRQKFNTPISAGEMPPSPGSIHHGMAKWVQIHWSLVALACGIVPAMHLLHLWRQRQG